jgi:hypothetical protein
MSLTFATPNELKAVLEIEGYKVIHESEFFWYMAKRPSDEPLTIPKESQIGFVSPDFMDNIMFDVQMSHHKFMLLRASLSKRDSSSGSAK